MMKGIVKGLALAGLGLAFAANTAHAQKPGPEFGIQFVGFDMLNPDGDNNNTTNFGTAIDPAFIGTTPAFANSLTSDVSGTIQLTLGGTYLLGFWLDSAGSAKVAQGLMQSDPNDAVRTAALATYARASGTAAVPALIAATAVGLPTSYRATAAAFLGQLKDRRGADALERLTAPSEPRNLRTGALNALVQLGDSARAAAVATKGLGDYDPLYAVQAVRVLGQVGGPAGRAALERARTSEPRVTVKAAIGQALKAR